MTKKTSFLSRFTKALREEEEVSAQDIDREVAAAVQAIKETSADGVEAAAVLGSGWREGGDLVHIMDMTPIYEVIGGRTGRLAWALQEACEHAFAQHVERGRGRAFFQGDRFYMRFAGIGAAEGF